MAIILTIVAVVILFFIFQSKKTVEINKLCFKPFPAWITTYVHAPDGSIDKATLAKSLILQVLIISKELSAFRMEDHEEMSRELNKFGAQESIDFVDCCIEQHLPLLEDAVDRVLIETSSARYVFMLTLIAAASVNPRGSVRDFLNKQSSLRRI